MSCVPYVASFTGLSFFNKCSVFSNIYLSCVLGTLCCQFLLDCPFLSTRSVFSNIYLSCVIVYTMLPVSQDCPFLINVRVFSNMYLSCVLCKKRMPVSLDCPFLLPLRYSLTFICPVSSVHYDASFSRLSFFITRSVFSNMYLSCV